MTAERRKIIMNAISQKAREIVPQGSEVILFGSQARGDARSDSDWDILILLDKGRISAEDIDDYGYPLRELGWDFNENINAILYSKLQWQQESFTPFYKNVLKDGIKLWG